MIEADTTEIDELVVVDLPGLVTPIGNSGAITMQAFRSQNSANRFRYSAAVRSVPWIRATNGYVCVPCSS